MSACTTQDKELKYSSSVKYSNSGFALIFDKNLIKNKIISKKIDERSLVIFHKHLTKETIIKVTNPLNDKFIIAQVEKVSKYPNFYNAVISKRIAQELEIDPSQPYIKLQTINLSSTSIANKAITYEEERNVADKAPVENISIKNISIEKSSVTIKPKNKKKLNDFNYIIKIADLFFKDSAMMLIKRLENEFNISNLKIKKMSKNTYRVYKGPFKNLDTIKNEFNNIDNLNFENIEIIKL